MVKEIFQVWLRILERCNLDYPGRLNKITMLLKRRRQEDQCQRSRCSDGRRGHRSIGQEPRIAGGLEKLVKETDSLLDPPERTQSCGHLHLNPVKLTSDITPLQI